MKKLLLTALLTSLALPALPVSAAVREVDRIVAVVNKNVITEQGLNARVAEAEATLKRQKVPLPPRDLLRQQVFEQMINEEAQLQYAEQTGLRLDEADLDRTIERIAQGNKLSVAEFKKHLAADGVPFARFRDQIRREVLIERVREREVDNKIQVSDIEVDLFLKSAVNANRDEYKLAHILISLPEQASPQVLEQRGRRAEEALQKLKGGAPFAQIAASYSDSRDNLTGGALGWRGASQMPADFVGVLRELKPGQISPILRSSAGLHILRLEDKRTRGAAQLVEQTQARHILIKTNEAISEADAKHRIDQIRDRLQNGMKFEEAARLYSEDASANRGGDLGWISPSDTVPEFERAMRALSPKTVSAPVRTPFGWHLIEVTGKRTEDIGQDQDRQAIKRELRTRKIEQQTQDWTRQQRDAAHVDLRLNDK